MLDAVKEILEFTKGKQRKDLDKNRLLALGMVRLLEVIGEAAAKLSQQFKEKHDTLPLRQMNDMRNRLIHGYFDVDLDIVWQTIVEDIPPLTELLEVILKDF